MSELRRVLFVTGQLAEPALRNMLAQMVAPFAWDVAALRITVAALMTTTWIARHLTVGEDTDLVLIPGLCEGDPLVIQDKVGVSVRRDRPICERYRATSGAPPRRRTTAPGTSRSSRRSTTLHA